MIAAIEGLRAVGALGIAASHSWPNAIKDTVWFDGAYLVVELFFVLSGYLFARVYADRIGSARDAIPIIVRRLGRMYPLHITVLLLWIALFYGKQLANVAFLTFGIDLGMTPPSLQPDFDWTYFALNVSLLHGIGIQDSILFNYPAWYVSADFWAFVIVAMAFAFVAQPAQRRRLAWVGIAVCMIHYLATWWAYGTPQAQDTPILYKSITRALASYCIGVLAWEWQRTRLPKSSDHRHSAWQLAAVLAITVLVPQQRDVPFSQWLVPMVWAGILISISTGQGWLARGLSGRRMVWMGERSYALYITHALLLLLFERRIMTIDDVWVSTALLFAYLAAAVGIAHLAYRWVELPAAAPFNRWSASISARTGQAHRARRLSYGHGGSR